MSKKPFRFGVVAGATEGGAKWLQTARRAEELGYSTLLCPDNLNLPTPTAALAAAAAVTTELKVGSFVLASPLRTARAAAWESHSLSVVTGNRFELGARDRAAHHAAASRRARPALRLGPGAARLHLRDHRPRPAARR
ncbi:hypothetical protein Amsp01_045280 [Amycolatopsis sp. NBRC 101858]|uniref:LLM class flavin-dependent oxidoreductase n=1 Tax=Amycolatopsis sp. NBRC 101858 TaxID=3032200 RepID=UPI00249FFAF9|nr:LLM class flavin-dependent oxidoreductase [Amycolatopsis sp. NBRC 101858]GLY38504.1 hypothetical protein Amsp01_045280 [Amycolatopsis sp. NBRC 101858]